MRGDPVTSERDFLGLVELLYASSTEPAQWPTFLERLGRLSGSEVVVLLLQDLSVGDGSWLWQWGLSPEAQEEYVLWAPRNPWMRAAEPLMHTGAVVRNAPVSRQELFATDFYKSSCATMPGPVRAAPIDPARGIETLPGSAAACRRSVTSGSQLRASRASQPNARPGPGQNGLHHSG